MSLSHTTRRTFLGGAAAAGAVVVAGKAIDAPIAAGRAAPPARDRLSAAETATLVAWCETLVPGARAADVGAFVNAQLAKAPADALLMLRYFSWPPPYEVFYKGGLAALESASSTAFRQPFTRLAAAQRGDLLQQLLGGAPWSGPPFFLFYLATRGDAVDVVYGTPEGFARIGAPYKPQIRPAARW